jgi:metallo-beta-lactamase family protein
VREACTVLFVASRPKGTMGRALVDGARKVSFFGEEVEVNADIRALAAVAATRTTRGDALDLLL